MKNILIKLCLMLPAILLQVLFYVILYNFFKPLMPIIAGLLEILAFIFVLYLIVSRSENTYKMLWAILIILFPILGGWLYMSFGNKRTAKPIEEKIKTGNKKIKFDGKTNDDILKKIQSTDILTYRNLNLISKKSGFPICYTKNANYYPLGDNAFPVMLEELKKANKSIYIEYFIIGDGALWNQISDILIEKKNQGVDVRVIYDDFGSIMTFSNKAIKKIEKAKIKILPFNPMYVLKMTLNNRTHRKMMIIDNKVVFSGGINLADEYINVNSPHGHWKDLAYKLDGDIVNSYTKMFIDFWNAYSKDKLTNNEFKELENKDCNNGYVLSYYDSPGNKFELSNNYFINILDTARDRVWFYTPYLILGDSLMDAMIRAAERGIDVRIMTPGIPDKKIVYRMTKSYYGPLIEAGVKIYEYKPGFVHAKASLVDDDLCSIGTVNLDYRSLFLHYECNSIFYESSIIKDLEKDYEKTLEKCRRITKVNTRFLHSLIDAILRLIAPLC